VPCDRDLCSRSFSFSLWSVFGFYPDVAVFYVCVELAFCLFSVMFVLLFNCFLYTISYYPSFIQFQETF
jgi:hypothetical protein